MILQEVPFFGIPSDIYLRIPFGVPSRILPGFVFFFSFTKSSIWVSNIPVKVPSETPPFFFF